MSQETNVKERLSTKDWIKVFYNDKLYIIHSDEKSNLENFLYERRTTIKYLQRKYGDIQELVK